MHVAVFTVWRIQSQSRSRSPATYHIKRVTGVVGKLLRDQKSLLPRGAVEQARSELLRVALQQGHTCK